VTTMNQGTRQPQSWTARSLLIAIGLALAGMMMAIQLMTWKLWPDVEWSFLVVPAVVASVFLALRHPGTGLLTALVFFPLLLFLMFYAAACLPLAPTG
jgi:hypothetical protein